jgi:hypothetical protein
MEPSWIYNDDISIDILYWRWWSDLRRCSVMTNLQICLGGRSFRLCRFDWTPCQGIFIYCIRLIYYYIMTYRGLKFTWRSYTRYSLCRLIRLFSTWCRAAAFFSARGAALSKEVPTVKWMSNQPALWTPDICGMRYEIVFILHSFGYLDFVALKTLFLFLSFMLLYRRTNL